MKFFRMCLVISLIILMSVPLTSTSFAAAKDYATLQWDINLSEVSDNHEGTIRITLTGVVGQQVDKYTVNSVPLPTPYYYQGPFVGFPDYSPNKPGEFVPVTGYIIHSSLFNGEAVVSPIDKLSQTIIELGEKHNANKVTNVKLIPIVEGAKMTIELIDCEYVSYYQFYYEAFKGTNPLLMTEVDFGRTATHFYEMWAVNNPVETRTFKKISTDYGTFQVYPFPDEFNTQDTPIAFYVVTEAEAKALKTNPSNLPTEMKAISTATPSVSKVLVNEKEVSFDAYTIKGNNYFKLRDLAKVVSGTTKQFSVGYDQGTRALVLTSGMPYTDVGGELSKGDGKIKTASATSSKVMVDGKETLLSVYMIGGNNYFKLRDVAKVFDINVGYDTKTKYVTINTQINPPPVRVEAESGYYGEYFTEWTGNTIDSEDFNASYGMAITGMSEPLDSIIFKEPPSSKAISVRYAKGGVGDGVLSLYINNVHIKNVTFPNTGGWNQYKDLAVEVDIPNNAEVTFQLDEGDSGTTIDCVDFYRYGITK